MTPVAPDYVNQVRGILGDLRQNYLEKQKMFQQDQQFQQQLARQGEQLALQREQLAQQKELEQSRLGLSYAQLSLQAANQNQQLQNDAMRISAAEAQNASETIRARASAQAQALNRDLEERKFKWDQLKTLQELEQKNALREQEVSAARLESELAVALESGDGLKVAEATNKAFAASLNIKQQTDAYKNALALVANKRMLDQDLINVKTRPQAVEIINSINDLDITKIGPDGFKNELSKANKQFYNLGNKDENLIQIFSEISKNKAKQQDEYQKAELGINLGQFETRAILGQLPKPDQKQWDELQAKYPGKEDRLSEDYLNKKTRLMYQTTVGESQIELQNWAKRINDIERNFLSQRPELAAKIVNQETGDVEARFPITPPDVSYSVGYDAAINPLTGKINPAKRKEYEAWLNDVSQKGYLNLPSQNPFMQAVMESMATRGLPPVSPAPTAKPQQTPTTPQPGKTPVTAQPNQETAQAGQPQIKVTQFSFPQVAEAGTAIIPIVPSAQGAPKIELSPEIKAKISEVVSLYNSNPDALYRGRPVRDVVAKLKQQLGTLPGLGQTPASNIVTEGQSR